MIDIGVVNVDVVGVAAMDIVVGNDVVQDVNRVSEAKIEQNDEGSQEDKAGDKILHDDHEEDKEEINSMNQLSGMDGSLVAAIDMAFVPTLLRIKKSDDAEMVMAS